MNGASLIFAAAGVNPLVRDLGLCLVVAGLLAVLFVRLRFPVIAALLGAGVMLGPAGFEAIQDRASVDTIASLGLTLLLFVIGLEVNLKSLLSSGKVLVVTGLLQVPLTLAVGFGTFFVIGLTGWGLSQGVYPALYLGVACAFSSTLLVVKYLSEHLKLDTVAGRLSVGLLIFQDIWAIVFLALQPSFSDPSFAPIVMTFLGTFFLSVLATAIARSVLPRVFQVVARSPELVVTAALGWCFGVALTGASLSTLLAFLGLKVEVSVSMEMGALIAGATIATSPYAYEVVARVVHLRDFFVTLFFVGIGMSIPVPNGAAVLLLAGIVAAVTVALRYLVFLPLLYAAGLNRRNSVAVSTKLAQVSEFCLVIAYLGAKLGHIQGEHVSAVIFAFVVTALATPLLFGVSDRLYERLKPVLDFVGIRSRGMQPEVESAEPPRLVLLAFHRVASSLLKDIERLHPDLLPHTVVVDTNAAIHPGIAQRGVKVVYGDVSSAEVLRHAGVAQAEVIVSTVPDELLAGTNNEKLVKQVRALAPNAVIIANCTKRSGFDTLRAAGADHIFRASTETAMGVLPAVYAALNASLESYKEGLDEKYGPLQAPEVLD